MTETTLHIRPDPGQVQAAGQPRNNLFLLRSSLIGREHELAIIQQLLLQVEVGLLTLIGPGGIGKTRLALQAAANLLDHFVDGVYFVSLAPISDPELVIVAIAQTLGVRESAGRPLQESLQDYLREKQLLLVLDNFEQILAAGPLVSALLSACQRIKVLVTSRATLHLYGEQEFPVSPLAVPDAERLPTLAQDPITCLTEFAAIELFCQRARAVKPDFVLTPANAVDVARICIGLDGLPLAIELAAARSKLFSPAALLVRLNQRLMLLTGGPHDLPARQRTLRDEIAWSYDLLSPAEQALFRRLAVFVGGFTLEAAQAVGDAGGDLGIDVLDGVASLVDKNLLRQEPGADSETRFGMLETIREYGLERLTASGEIDLIHRHHAAFFLQLAERTEPTLLGRWRKQRLAQLEGELDNFRTALRWSQTDASGTETGLRLAGALAWFAHFANHANEGRHWLIAVLQRAAQPTPARAKALWGAGLMALVLGEYQQAPVGLEESAALWRTIGDQRGLAVALRELCIILHFLDQRAVAQRCGEESVALWRALGSPWDLALALDNLAFVVAAQGDQERAHTLFEEELVLFEAVGDAWGQATALNGLGCLAGRHGDYATARVHFTKALALRRAEAEKLTLAEALLLLGEVVQRQGELEEASKLYCECLIVAHENGSKAVMAHVLPQLGTIAQAQTQLERAVRLFASAAALRTVDGDLGYHSLATPAEREQTIIALRTRLDEATFTVRWAEGQAMTLEQAIDYALTASSAPEATASTSEGHPVVARSPDPAGLSAREVEVLRLLAQRFTHPQIAEKLVISRRTVNAHVTSIYSKLGVNQREAAIRFAVEHRLL